MLMSLELANNTKGGLKKKQSKTENCFIQKIPKEAILPY